MTKNRDFNGNGYIDSGNGSDIFDPNNPDDKGYSEIRWYTPVLNQLLGVWIGEQLYLLLQLYTENPQVNYQKIVN